MGTADPPAYMLPGVNLFASGIYRGKPWPPATLRMIAANGRKLGTQGLHVPPGVAKPLVPEGGVGHDEAEDKLDWLDKTDLPAAGQVDTSTLKVVPDPDNAGHLILVGDMVNVPPVTAGKIKSGEYNRGSAELYDDFTDDFGNSHGPALRRHVILGGDVPQVKRLGRLPMPVPQSEIKVFSEGRTVRPGACGLWTFAERIVDPTQLKTAIQAAMPNLSKSFLDGLTPDALAELAANLPSSSAQPGQTQQTPQGQINNADDGGTTGGQVMSHDDLVTALGDLGQAPASLAGMSDSDLQALYDQLSGSGDSTNLNPMDDSDPGTDPAMDATTMGGGMADATTANSDDIDTYADTATPSRDDMITALQQQGQDPATLAAMSDSDLTNLYQQLTGASASAGPTSTANMADGDPTVTTPAAKPPVKPPVTRCAEPPKKKVDPAQAALARAQEITRLSELANKRIMAAHHKSKRDKVDTFCEKMLREGRIVPAQMADYKTLLYGLDDLHEVHNFTEPSTKRLTKLTALDRKMAEIKLRPPVVKFGEKHPNDPKDAKRTANEQVNIVERFCELNGRALRQVHGTRPDKLIELARKRAIEDPDNFTAASLIGQAAVDMVT